MATKNTREPSPTLAFMRATEEALVAAFPGYRRRLNAPRTTNRTNPFTGTPIIVEEYDPGEGRSLYQPRSPPLPFASLDAYDGPNGEDIGELYLSLLGEGLGTDYQHYGEV